MGPFWLIVLIAALALAGIVAGRVKAGALAKSSGERLHSRPAYYGSYIGVWTALPALILLTVLMILRPSSSTRRCASSFRRRPWRTPSSCR